MPPLLETMSFWLSTEKDACASRNWFGGFDSNHSLNNQANTTMTTKLHTNDTVCFCGEMWRVVCTINGSKADLQRLHSSNPRIITVPVDSLQLEVVQRFGSPNCSF